MKILHVIPNLGVGGTEKILLELCGCLDKARFENSVVSLKSGGRTMASLEKIPVQVICLKSPDALISGSLDMLRLHFRLKDLIKKISPDIVHTWLPRANIIGRLAARDCSCKVISSLRVMEIEKKYHLWAEKLTHNMADVVTVNSTLLKDFAVRRIGIPEKKIAMIFNGIEMAPRIEKMPAKTRNKAVIFGAMGRLHKQKGMDIFLEASQKVSDRFPESRFQIAGEGPEKQSLKKLAQKLGIADKVAFRGLVQIPEDFFGEIDVFVLSSRWEGMPNVVLEAMAFQKPIVATLVGGVTDLLMDGVHGLLVPSEDPEALAQAMMQMAVNMDFGRKLGQAAYSKAADQFSLDKMVHAYASLYESIYSKM